MPLADCNEKSSNGHSKVLEVIDILSDSDEAECLKDEPLIRSGNCDVVSADGSVEEMSQLKTISNFKKHTTSQTSDQDNPVLHHFEVLQFIDLDKQSATTLPKLVIRRLKIDPVPEHSHCADVCNGFDNSQRQHSYTSAMTLAMDSLALLNSTYPRQTLEEIKSSSLLDEPVVFEMVEPVPTIDPTTSSTTLNESPIKPEHSKITFTFVKRKPNLKTTLSFTVSPTIKRASNETKQEEHMQIKRKDFRRNRRPNETENEYEERLQKLESRRIYMQMRNARMENVKRKKTQFGHRPYYGKQIVHKNDKVLQNTSSKYRQQQNVKSPGASKSTAGKGKRGRKKKVQ